MQASTWHRENECSFWLLQMSLQMLFQYNTFSLCQLVIYRMQSHMEIDVSVYRSERWTEDRSLNNLIHLCRFAISLDIESINPNQWDLPFIITGAAASVKPRSDSNTFYKSPHGDESVSLCNAVPVSIIPSWADMRAGMLLVEIFCSTEVLFGPGSRRFGLPEGGPEFCGIVVIYILIRKHVRYIEAHF